MEQTKLSGRQGIRSDQFASVRINFETIFVPRNLGRFQMKTNDCSFACLNISRLLFVICFFPF